MKYINLKSWLRGAVLVIGITFLPSLWSQSFTKIASGSIVTDVGNSHGCAWGDYDGDGNPDLFVANWGGLNNFLYHNNGDGTFTKITTGSIVNDGGNSTSCTWGDYDNDGHLDLFVANAYESNFLYHNNGNGTFAKVTSGAIVTDVGGWYGCAWGDYDNDGYVDLYVANATGVGMLYHNNRDGTFSKIPAGNVVADNQNSASCAWGDYDNDGWLDLFVAKGANQEDALYHNSGDGTFTKVTTGGIVVSGSSSDGCAWGDYDNDGYLDLYVPNRLQPGFLFHNNGNGTFTRITSGSIVTDVNDGNGCSWGDYNNDGYLDLFVANWTGQNDALYQNNGNGTFTRITTGDIVTAGGNGIGCGWGDFNNDGQLDLFVSNGGGQNNFLYRNDGNANSRITLKGIGTTSNRSAIGAKIKVRATIGGITGWQTRQISSANGWDGNDLRATFGLGDASIIETLRIEWPSGVVQEQQNVAVNQVLTITEPLPVVPVITLHPQSRTVGFGANVTFSVQASGVSPLTYQWRFKGIDIAGATSTTLILNGVDSSDQGDYTVVVTNPNGSATSHGAILTVLTTFTKMSLGSIVTDLGNSHGCAWGDYDSDGDLDLFVPNYGLNNFLYRNDGDGTFTKITTGSIVNDGGNSTSCTWGDYDNDGHLDLFVANAYESNFLYHNNGNGTFAKVTSGAIVTDVGGWYGCAWGDYDNDGYVDLYVANATGVGLLYHNNRDGTFSKIPAGNVVADNQNSASCAWGDYDNDGWLDLFVAKGANQEDALYHNSGDGTFTKVTTGGVVVSGSSSDGCAWGDYDNDGYLDLYVPNRLQPGFLFHNNGNGTFTRITSGSIVTDVNDANGCSWGDYNNDGYLDLFVANWTGQNDALYQNNGNGTFTRITTGDIVTAGGNGIGCGWGDFNNDGQLDLFVSNGGGQNNFLYRNDGNANSRITLKGIGTTSNRSAIGAKIKVRATIGGITGWQTRQISSANGWDGNDLRATFGLGDAPIIETLRIEWPSGVVQELQNVAVNQILTVTEPLPVVPVIAVHPQSQTVGFGANVTFSVQASGVSPLTYQWRFKGIDIAGATSTTLILNGVDSSDQGDYTVVVTNPNGSTSSHGANLTVLTTFTKITSGSIVTDIGNSGGSAWGDYDGDGDLDLFVSNYGLNNFLYRNNGDGTFTKITTGSIVNDGGNSMACAWGDYDNDGHLDLFVANAFQSNFLYHNNGDGTFTRITTGSIATDTGGSYGCAWGDYDRDGYLDLYVANVFTGSNFLYHNNGNGTFTRILSGSLVTDPQDSNSCAWGDYDNDGWLDLFVANGSNGKNSLYHNNKNGTFTKITAGPPVSEESESINCAWGDYDNDGYLDLFVANRDQKSFLYHNSGDGTFTKITSGDIVNDITFANGCSWGDYDNDGYLDLFVANWNGQNNAIYKNNGDGTFTKITTGSLVNDSGNSTGCGWGDFNGDGFLDLFVSNSGGQSNFLYANDQNDNSRIIVNCIGTGSNRSAIGARIHVHATIHGQVKSQTRYISSGNGWDGHDLQAHFGLGDATIIEEMFIYWPSGQSQILHDVPVNVILNVTEPSDPADLSVVKTVTPNPAVQGSILTYTITVANNGPGAALGVKVTDAPPPGVDFLFAFSSQGNCTGTNPVVCNLGNMAANSSATIVILATTTTGGVHPALYTIENTATVTALSTDPNSSNNSAATVSTIRTDSDGDGIPDDYEEANGLNKNSPSDGSMDWDGDGFNNLQEFLLGTNPQDPANTLEITATEQVGNDIRISFSTVAGKTYSSEYCDVYPTVSWTPFASNILGTGGDLQVTDIGGASGPKRFYRIKLVQ